MANLASAKKRIRQNARRRKHNTIWRTRARTYVKNARLSIASGDHEAAQTAVAEAIRALDKAASKGVIHPRNAARRKSRLMKQFQSN